MNLKEVNFDVLYNISYHMVICLMAMNYDVKYYIVKLIQSIVILWVKSSVYRSINYSSEIEDEGYN